MLYAANTTRYICTVPYLRYSAYVSLPPTGGLAAALLARAARTAVV